MREGCGAQKFAALQTADHSLPFCVAVSLVDSEYGLRQLKEKRWEAPEVQETMRKMRFIHDRKMDERFPPDRPSRLTIVTQDGRKLVKEIPYPKGDYRSPFSDEEIADKFKSLSVDILNLRQQEIAIDRGLNFSSGSVCGLLDACTREQ